jgi:hypothetical protein
LGGFDIIANYKVTINPGTIYAPGADRYFEVAFDVHAFVLGTSEEGWKLGDYNNNSGAPQILTKSRNQQIVNENVTVDIEYSVILRSDD